MSMIQSPSTAKFHQEVFDYRRSLNTLQPASITYHMTSVWLWVNQQIIRWRPEQMVNGLICASLLCTAGCGELVDWIHASEKQLRQVFVTVHSCQLVCARGFPQLSYKAHVLGVESVLCSPRRRTAGGCDWYLEATSLQALGWVSSSWSHEDRCVPGVLSWSWSEVEGTDNSGG